MQMVTFIAIMLAVLILLNSFASEWWIGVIIFITFSNFPDFVPATVDIGGYNVTLHEVPLFLGALFLLINRPANRITDWSAAGIGTFAAVGTMYGLGKGNDLAATINDLRGTAAISLTVFIVGRIAWTPQAQTALRAVRITLWFSLIFTILAASGFVTLSSGSFSDAALMGKGFGGETGVTRILGPATHLASVVVAIVVALWAVEPQLMRRATGYLVPALGITIIGYSRNAIIIIAVTLLLTPIFHRSSRGAVRAVTITIVGIAGFLLAGLFLSLANGIPGFAQLQTVYSAYSGRVFGGMTGFARQHDQSVLYRVGETRWLKNAITGHELFGRGFGYRYRPPDSAGFASGTYFAHNFYLWAIVKAGWCGLIAYMIAFVSPAIHALIGRGRFALRSAAGAAIVGHWITLSVVPTPEDVYRAPVLGALIGIALLRGPMQSSGTDSASAGPSEIRSNSAIASRPS